MLVRTLQGAPEYDHMVIGDKIHDFDFFEHVARLFNKYIHTSSTMDSDTMVKMYVGQTIEDDVEILKDDYVYTKKQKTNYCKFFKLNYGFIDGLEYIGVPELEDAQGYLNVINALPLI